MTKTKNKTALHKEAATLQKQLETTAPIDFKMKLITQSGIQDSPVIFRMKAPTTFIEFKIKAPETPLDGYYWVAINGTSCEANLSGPMSLAVQCKPTPMNLIGFPSREEALETQCFCLTATDSQIEQRLEGLLEREDVVIKEFIHPEPPKNDGRTIWIDPKDFLATTAPPRRL